MSLQYGDEKQRQLVSELWDIDKGKIPVESLSLPSNARRFLIARETIPVNFKRKIFWRKGLDTIPTYEPKYLN